MCDRLQDETQKMAEGFIKAGCIQRGFAKYLKIHDFEKLAQSVRSELGDEDFATTIESLNGNSADDNLTRYEPNQDPTRIAAAINRLCNLCDAFPRELHRHAAAFRRENEIEALADLSELASSTARQMSLAQETLSGLKKVDPRSVLVTEETAARVHTAWEGVDSIRKAMSRAERDILIEFHLSKSAEQEAGREIDDE